jgi:8-oxo-dGTP pyrophosphatase MutT (NUDIX family)
MKDDLKIYYNDSFVLITPDRTQMSNNFTTILTDEKEIDKFFSTTKILFDGITNETILVVSDNPQKLLRNFRAQVKEVIAGGGIVFNENDDLLMIFRRGKWDLPKGKIEPGEEIIEGAKREVEEETGVTVANVSPKAVHTFHAYKLKGKDSLKETSWYEMKAKTGQNKPVPQIEEDIDEVKWVSRKDLKKYETGCYPLIWGLIKDYAR